MEKNREHEILVELDGYKWQEQFVCLKCGNKSFIKGEEPFSRRCSNSKCKKEVSLKKYTAFEGLRFPIEKAYGILEEIVRNASLGRDQKVIPIKKRRKKELSLNDIFNHDEFRDDEVEYISIGELLERTEKRKGDEDILNEKLAKIIRDYQPSVGRLAKRFEIEENTVIKFLDKINNRIPLEKAVVLNGSLERILDYPMFNGETTVSHLIGMAMVPLVGEWKYGILEIGGYTYGIEPIRKNDGPWTVFQKSPLIEDGRLHSVDEYHILYGTDKWYEIFKANNDK